MPITLPPGPRGDPHRIRAEIPHGSGVDHRARGRWWPSERPGRGRPSRAERLAVGHAPRRLDGRDECEPYRG